MAEVEETTIKIQPSLPINGVRFCSRKCDYYLWRNDAGKCMLDKRVRDDVSGANRSVCPFWAAEVVGAANLLPEPEIIELTCNSGVRQYKLDPNNDVICTWP